MRVNQMLINGIAILALFLLASKSYSDIIVDKESVILQNIKPGKTVIPTHLLPKVRNTSKSPIRCKVSFHMATECRRGYRGLSEISWVTPSEAVILLEPDKETRIMGVQLNIPDTLELYNQHYQSILTVTSEGAISSEIAIPVWIETEGVFSKNLASLSKSLGFMPTSLDLKSNKPDTIYLYNNSEATRTFVVFLLFPAEKSKSNILPQSPGYEWMKDDNSLEISVEKQKAISRNRFEGELRQGELLQISVVLKDEWQNHNERQKNSQKRKQEGLLVVVTSHEWKFARIRANF